MERSGIVDIVTIREVEQDDLADLEWEGEFSHFRRLYSEIYRRTQTGEALMWMAELGGIGLIGQVFVQLASYRPELADGNLRAYVYGFRVRPTYRNQGLGTKMMQVVEDDLRERGYQWVMLNVGRDNPKARRLYERLGYVVIGPDPGRWSYLDDKGERHYVHEPAWRMQKVLNDRV